MFRVRWGRLPLTQRLTLLFTAVAASVVLGLGALFLVESERHFVELDRMALQNKQRLIEDLLRNANSADDARGRLGEALSYHHGLYALVQDGQGFVVFRSQGLSPPMRGEEALHTGEGPAFGVWHHGNARFHTLAFKAAPAYSPTPLSVWIAADTEHHTQFLDGLRRDLALYVLVAIAICGLLSWFAARQGLA
nr:two-component sensor histidine kinase [Comamonas denitrificans]